MTTYPERSAFSTNIPTSSILPAGKIVYVISCVEPRYSTVIGCNFQIWSTVPDHHLHDNPNFVPIILGLGPAWRHTLFVERQSKWTQCLGPFWLDLGLNWSDFVIKCIDGSDFVNISNFPYSCILWTQLTFLQIKYTWHGTLGKYSERLSVYFQIFNCVKLC